MKPIEARVDLVLPVCNSSLPCFPEIDHGIAYMVGKGPTATIITGASS